MQKIPPQADGSGAGDRQKAATSHAPTTRFTLIELLAALVLALIIAGTAMTAFVQTTGVGSLANARIDAMHNARTALDIIEDDLTSAWIDPDGGVFWGVNPDYLDPEANFDGGDPADGPIECAFVDLSKNHAFLKIQNLSGQGAVMGPARVNYYWWVDENEDLHKAVLIRSAQPANSGINPVPEDKTDDVAAFNVTGLKVRYFYDKEPYDTWDSEDDENDVMYRRIPEAVEVTIETVDDKGVLLREENEPVRIRRLIEPGAGLTE